MRWRWAEAAVLCAAAGAEVAVRGPHGPALLAVAPLALAATAPGALLGPVAAAIAVAAACALSLATTGVLALGALAALGLALHRAGRPFVPVLALPFVVIALAAPGPVPTLAAVLSPAAAYAGIARRSGREARRHEAARAAIADTVKDHTARGERARIARELHDVVAHHISMIAVQAETARLTTPGLPAAGALRLTEIGDTARTGLTEMRRLLGVLREDAAAEIPERRPQPGLQQLNELLDDARKASGAAARLIVSGPPATLDPGVELAAYRIVQEALTNARRHAPGAAVDVELRFAGETLLLRIRDNGPGPAEGGTGGHGLAGMRERAAAAGGGLATGTAPGGGFLVEAALPLKGTA